MGRRAFIIRSNISENNSNEMKKYLFLFVLLAPAAFAQQTVSPCKSQVVLDYQYEGYIDVFYSVEDDFSFAKIRNNPFDDTCVEVEITGRTEKMFQVNMRVCLGEYPFRMTDVFIKKENLIILSRLLNHPMPLYASPSESGAVNLSVNYSHGYVYRVIDCWGEWLKVSFLDDTGKEHEGWMAPRFQCSNVYSACKGM